MKKFIGWPATALDQLFDLANIIDCSDLLSHGVAVSDPSLRWSKPGFVGRRATKSGSHSPQRANPPIRVIKFAKPARAAT